MKESLKATNRRKERAKQWNPIIRGKVIDVGPGDDILVWPGAEVTGFDMGDGDANRLHEYFEAETFDCLHASQCLEHMHNPFAALASWSKVVKPGGHLVITVPDLVRYEGLRVPSKWNPDHKSSWSMDLPGSPYGDNHVHVGGSRWEEAVREAGLEPVVEMLVDTNFNYSLLGKDVDQTWVYEHGVECFLELVYQKRI